MKYYLVGIKGSGMSALANILIKDGHIVEGVDVKEDFYTSEVLKGVNVIEFEDFSIKDDFIYIIGNAYINHKITNLIIEANMKYETYPKFIDKYFKRLSMIGVAGTHGKTMTSSMLKDIMLGSTYLIGDGKSDIGKNGYFILEACEYKDTFLNYKPDFGLVLNIDYDHPDYFKNYNDYLVSFIKYMNNCKVCVINGDVISYRDKHIITYGMNKDNDIIFTYDSGEVIINDEKYELPFKGVNYAYNFVGVYIISKMIGIKDYLIKNRLKEYKFPKRRNERINYNNMIVINDYAHHPTEIINVFNSLKEEYPNKNIICIFEPHTISRLKIFEKEYKKALDLFDKCYLYKVFTSVREKDDFCLVNEIYNRLGYSLYDDNTLNEMDDFNGVLCFLGAGNIDKLFSKRYLFNN